jgi:hypothetical protein
MLRSIQPPFPIHRQRSDAFRIRYKHRRLVVFIDFENGIVVFLRYKRIAVLVSNDAMCAVPTLPARSSSGSVSLVDFC